MKLLVILFLVCSASFADEPKEQQPITISAPKSLATFNPKTQEWSMEKGAKAEDVMTALLRELQTVYARTQDVEKNLKACEEKGKKK